MMRIKPDPTKAKPSKPVPSASRADDIELVQQSEPRVSTQVLATHLGTKHRSAMALLDKHREAFERIGQVTFEMSNGSRAQGGGRAERIGLLTEDQAYLLLAMGRNTDKVVDLKVRLVQAFSQARKAAADRLSHQAEPGWRDARQETKDDHRLIGLVLQATRARDGKESTEKHHYMNEARLIRHAMTGSVHAELCRSCLGVAGLRVLAAVQKLNAQLLIAGEEYQLRKARCRVFALEQLEKLERLAGYHADVMALSGRYHADVRGLA